MWLIGFWAGGAACMLGQSLIDRRARGPLPMSVALLVALAIALWPLTLVVRLIELRRM